MAAKTALPTKEQVLRFIQSQPAGVEKRAIMRAFGVKGADRVAMKGVLAALQSEGLIGKGGKRFADPSAQSDPPPIAVLTVLANGRAELANGDASPPIRLAPPKRSDPKLVPGDTILARLKPHGEGFVASLIKRISGGAHRVLGVYHDQGDKARVTPVDKKNRDEYVVDTPDRNGACDGDLVVVEPKAGRGFGMCKARIVDVIGNTTVPRAIALIAMKEQGIDIEFPNDALAEAQAAQPIAAIGERLDLREVPLITIDPAEARDHDDAVAATPDKAANNPKGWVVWVAIADVAHYVTPGSALDKVARERGNAAYFPDRVAPMLPERLSADLCSLRFGEERPCLAARIRITAQGRMIEADFHRAIMKSAAALTYRQAQDAIEGRGNQAAAAVLESTLKPIFAAFEALKIARAARDPLELELPERKIELGEDGSVLAITLQERFDAHRVIEEFMILANVAAAQMLEKKRQQFLYRVHEEPARDKLEGLREILTEIGTPLVKGQGVTTKLLNRALAKAAETEHTEMANMAVLRAQSQAYYAPKNFGHFGLGLRAYAHFTSPIRRYADLIVHRALIAGLALPGFEQDGLTDAERAQLLRTSAHISRTERRAMTAERDTVDRYLAAYLAAREGAQFSGRISGVKSFGIFVKLDEIGADGFVPIKNIGDEYFRYDEARSRLVGERSRFSLRLGQPVSVRLIEATPVSGGLLFELLDLPRSTRLKKQGAKPGTASSAKARRRK